jgi:hypothetical protein
MPKRLGAQRGVLTKRFYPEKKPVTIGLPQGYRKYAKRSDNPYIPPALDYFQREIFPKVCEYISKIAPPNKEIDYLFNDKKPWFVVAPTYANIYDKEIIVAEPTYFGGGRIWFRLFVDGKEMNKDLEVEWDEECTEIKITRQELHSLCFGTWQEPPTDPFMPPATTYDIWATEKANVAAVNAATPVNRHKLHDKLIFDLSNGCKTMGLTFDEVRAHIVVESMLEKNKDVVYNSPQYNHLVGKTINAYRQLVL